MHRHIIGLWPSWQKSRSRGEYKLCSARWLTGTEESLGNWEKVIMVLWQFAFYVMTQSYSYKKKSNQLWPNGLKADKHFKTRKTCGKHLVFILVDQVSLRPQDDNLFCFLQFCFREIFISFHSPHWCITHHTGCDS